MFRVVDKAGHVPLLFAWTPAALGARASTPGAGVMALLHFMPDSHAAKQTGLGYIGSHFTHSEPGVIRVSFRLVKIV